MTLQQGIPTLDKYIRLICVQQLTTRNIPADFHSRKELHEMDALRDALSSLEDAENLSAVWTSMDQTGTIASRSCEPTAWFNAAADYSDSRANHCIKIPRNLDVSEIASGDYLFTFRWAEEVDIKQAYSFFLVKRSSVLAQKLCRLFTLQCAEYVEGAVALRREQSGALTIPLHGSVRKTLTQLEPSFSRRIAEAAINALPEGSRHQLSENDVGQFMRHLLLQQPRSLNAPTLAFCDSWGEAVSYWKAHKLLEPYNSHQLTESHLPILLNEIRKALTATRRDCLYASLAHLLSSKGLRIQHTSIESVSRRDTGVRLLHLASVKPAGMKRRMVIVSEEPANEQGTLGIVDDFSEPINWDIVRRLRRRADHLIIVADDASKAEREKLARHQNVWFVDTYAADA